MSYLFDTSIEKLRKKYTNKKTKCRKLTDRIKWLVSKKWIQEVKNFNKFLAETHEDLAVSAREEDLLSPLNVEPDFKTSLSGENEENNINRHRSMQKKRRKKELVVALQLKRKVARSQTQGLSQLASGMEKIAAATLKKQ